MTSLPAEPGPIEHWHMEYEPNLEELLADDLMEPVMRSAQIDRNQIRRQLSEMALRVYQQAAAEG